MTGIEMTSTKPSFRRASAWLPLLDISLAAPTYVAARLLRLVRRLTMGRMPRSAGMIERVNIYPLIDHYYEPQFNLSRLRRPLDEVRDLPGLALDDTAALAYLENLLPRHGSAIMAKELAACHFDNDQFGPGDADVLHAILRRHPPRTIIEIGCGWSSRIIAHALDLNAGNDPRGRARHVCIEPYPSFDLTTLGAELIRKPIEDCEPALFSELRSGDVLFIDSSHMIRPQGDVLFEVGTILPRLPSGVLVHVHDIFTPRDYSSRLMQQHRVFWNEQYLLEAFLAFNPAFEVVLPLNHLWQSHRDTVVACCPNLGLQPLAEPASFWLRRR